MLHAFPRNCVCAEYTHPIETSKNSETANAIQSVTLSDITSHAKTRTRPRANAKLRLRAGVLSRRQHHSPARQWHYSTTSDTDVSLRSAAPNDSLWHPKAHAPIRICQTQQKSPRDLHLTLHAPRPKLHASHARHLIDLQTLYDRQVARSIGLGPSQLRESYVSRPAPGLGGNDGQDRGGKQA